MPVGVEQLLIADLIRVVGHFHGLDMTGAAADHILIAGGLHRAAHEAGAGIGHALHMVESLLRTPETPTAEDGCLGRGGQGIAGETESQQRCHK